ncbi:DUF3530 family protein [Thalassotalea euphylliae]|uniref:DUF3530 family protein n=1 Tax=Thalassotalea euphylliae TaxID=1655234 RepID=A0A3E0U482_9GAMM|nr:DUF3530 family protein [Thalassotalea euphylliae]REL31736.1 DUF3530 family protein [Thalassotalea euphylliae]
MKHSISVIFFFAISLLLSTTSVNAQQAPDADQAASDSAMQDKSMQEKNMQDKNMADGDMKSGDIAGKDMAGKDMADDQPNIRPPVSLIEQFTQDIERSLDSSLVNPMLAGTEDFLTILQPDNHSTDRGIAILLPEWNQAATDTRAINFLRQHLPNEGWTTIAIQPITKPENYPSQQLKPSLAAEENKEMLTKYAEQLAPMLTSVMEKAAEYPGVFLVIAQGNNAAILLDLYEQAAVEQPNALITLSAHRQSAAGNQRLAEQIADSELPVLDIVLKKDVHWIKYFAQDRQKAAKRELKPIYRQRELTNFRAGYYPEERLAKEIKGWLTTVGW